MADPRTPRDPIGQLAARIDGLNTRIEALATPSGSAANQTVAQLQRLVNDIKTQLDDYIANGTYNKAQIDNLLAGKVDTTGTVAQSQIGATGQTQGQLTANGDVTGQRGIFPTGVRSTGARNNQVVTNYVAAYLDGNGNLGFAPSTKASKNDHGPYLVDMAKFLAIDLRMWSYKDDPAERIGMGPFAEDLDAAGLSEFVLYSDEGKIQGVRLESLVMGLWSAYVQSRTSTLARISRQLYQESTLAGMTALGLNAEKTYDVAWSREFADADYLVSATVATTAGLALAAVASVVPGSRTTKGCKVTVRTLGLALASGAVLTVQGVHV